MTHEFNVEIGDIGTEDSGMAKICHLEGEDENEVFFRLQSWDETKEHKELADLGIQVGLKYKLTLTLVD